MLYILIVALILLVLRFDLFLVFIITSVSYILIFTHLPGEIAIQRMFSGVDKFPLIAIPMFIFSAKLMADGGMAQRIINFSLALVGPLPGGLAMAVVVACMFFGAVSGSSPATVIAIGSVMYPALLQAKYPKNFSLGLITSSSAVSIIIPPSIGLIIYGTVANVSIGSLFIASIIPGLLYGLVFLLYSYYVNRKRSSGTYSIENIFSSFKGASWAMGVPIIIVGGIYGGVMTPTEAAAVCAAYTFFVARYIYRSLSYYDVLKVAKESGIITAQIMILVACASVLSWILTIERIPASIASWTQLYIHNKYLMLFALSIIFIIAGMFLDPTSVTLIFAPLFIPILSIYDINPIHFGIIILVNGALGMFTPPFGLNNFVASTVFKEPVVEISKNVIPFIWMGLIVVFMVTFFEQLSLMLLT